MEAKKVTRRTFLKMAGAAGGAALAASGGAGALADAFKAPRARRRSR
ncbi:MAG: twin-arginine translocation signal domain-containing protein [Anaerolineae bacterium]|nr:twin-arginine translocation signal domain-containing protein [Anaerolineae bacterium]